MLLIDVCCIRTLRCTSSYQAFQQFTKETNNTVQLLIKYIVCSMIIVENHFVENHISFSNIVFKKTRWNVPLWSIQFHTGLAPSQQFDGAPQKTGLIYPHLEDGPDHALEQHSLIKNGFEWFLKLLIGLERTFDSRREKTKERDKIKGLLIIILERKGLWMWIS